MKPFAAPYFAVDWRFLPMIALALVSLLTLAASKTCDERSAGDRSRTLYVRRLQQLSARRSMGKCPACQRIHT